MAEKITTFGAKLYRGTYATANIVAQVGSIGPIDFTRGDVDTTTHDDNWSTFLPGKWDGGDIQARIAWDPQDTNHIGLWTTDTGSSVPTTALVTWFVVCPSKADGTKVSSLQFSGYVKSFSLEANEIEGHRILNVTFKVSGLPVFTPDDTTDPDA